MSVHRRFTSGGNAGEADECQLRERAQRTARREHETHTPRRGFRFREADVLAYRLKKLQCLISPTLRLRVVLMLQEKFGASDRFLSLLGSPDQPGVGHRNVRHL